MPIFSAL